MPHCHFIIETKYIWIHIQEYINLGSPSNMILIYNYARIYLAFIALYHTTYNVSMFYFFIKFGFSLFFSYPITKTIEIRDIYGVVH
jgi:hypothetical protein